MEPLKVYSKLVAGKVLFYLKVQAFYLESCVQLYRKLFSYISN